MGWVRSQYCCESGLPIDVHGMLNLDITANTDDILKYDACYYLYTKVYLLAD